MCPLIFLQALIRSPAGPSSFSTSLSEAGVKMVSLVAKIIVKSVQHRGHPCIDIRFMPIKS